MATTTLKQPRELKLGEVYQEGERILNHHSRKTAIVLNIDSSRMTVVEGPCYDRRSEFYLLTQFRIAGQSVDNSKENLAIFISSQRMYSSLLPIVSESYRKFIEEHGGTN